MTEALDTDQLKALLTVLVPELKAKRRRLKGVIDQLKAENKTYAPRGQTQEHRYLDSLTHTAWGAKIATTYAQELNVNGFRTLTADPATNDPAWELWDEARMAIMQDIILREAFQYGETFCAALSTTLSKKALAKPLPPVHTVALYDDPVTDVWPKAVLSTIADRKTSRAVSGTLYVADWVYVLEFSDGLDADTVKFGKTWQHKSENTPVIRFFDELDSQGRTTGKIEPNLALLERIRKDTYDRQLIQHKSSWKVRTATGLEPDEDTEQSTEQTKLKLAVEDILVTSNPDAKFGTLDETPLDNLITAKEADVFELAVMAQLPPSAVLPGKVQNIAAETIAELRSSFDNRIADHKSVMGDSFGWLIQALAVQAGLEPDMKARCTWEDRSSRSLAQAADAWSKIVPSLQVPVQAAWARLPGVTTADVMQWENMRKREQGRMSIESIFNPAPVVEPAVEEEVVVPA